MINNKNNNKRGEFKIPYPFKEAVINGRKYSTITAKFITGRYNEDNQEEWGALLQKKTSEFFFVGVYYPLYFKHLLASDEPEELEHCRDMMKRARNIFIALTDDEAKRIAEEWCSFKEYVELFGEVEE